MKTKVNKKVLLQFDQASYESYVKSIKDFASLLIDATAEIARLRAGKYAPGDIMDGAFVARVLAFHKKEWSGNTALKFISFEKYLEFIELDCTTLTALEKDYNDRKDQILEFYPENNSYYQYCKHRYPELLKEAPLSIKLRMADLYEFKEQEIKVNLDPELFKLYATSEQQLAKIRDIENYIQAASKIGADYLVIRKTLAGWVRSISADYTKTDIDYFYLIRNVT